MELNEDGRIIASRLRGSGCPELLQHLLEMRTKLNGGGLLVEVALPRGSGHAAMLMRELLLKARGEWNYPYGEEELCHCRSIPTAKVDQAIVGGCHTVSAVSRQTSAGTACGTCRPDIETILAYRLGRR